MQASGRANDLNSLREPPVSVRPRLEQVTGLEPANQPWKGRVLPLHHTCVSVAVRVGPPLPVDSPGESITDYCTDIRAARRT